MPSQRGCSKLSVSGVSYEVAISTHRGLLGVLLICGVLFSTPLLVPAFRNTAFPPVALTQVQVIVGPAASAR